jgi:hypothetical protein
MGEYIFCVWAIMHIVYLIACFLTCGLPCFCYNCQKSSSLKSICKCKKINDALEFGPKYDKYEKQLNRKLSKATDLVRMMRF